MVKKRTLAERQVALEAHFDTIAAWANATEKTLQSLAEIADQAGWAVAQCKDHGREAAAIRKDIGALRVYASSIGLHIAWTPTFWGRLRWLVTGR